MLLWLSCRRKLKSNKEPKIVWEIKYNSEPSKSIRNFTTDNEWY